MRKIIQLIGAVLAGLVLAFIITVQFEKLGAAWYPLPEANPDPLTLTKYWAESPAALHWLSVLGYGLSTFFGAYLGGRLSPVGQDIKGAMVTSFCFALPVIVLLLSIPRPMWAGLSCIAAMILSTLVVYGVLGRLSRTNKFA